MTTRARVLVMFGLVFLLGGLARVAEAQDQSRELARRHFARGEELYKAGDYRKAIVEFRAADALVPSPILSFNIGLCHEKLGEGAEAVRLFRDYLARRPDAPNRSSVEARIARLEAQLATAPGTPGGGAPGDLGPPVPGPTVTDPGTVGPPAGSVHDHVEVGPEPGGAPVETAPGGAAAGSIDAALAERLPRRGPAFSAGSAVAGAAGPPLADGPAEQAPPPDAPPRADKPIYKKWWFWAIVGVSAIVIIDVATADGGSGGSARMVGPAEPLPGGGLEVRF